MKVVNIVFALVCILASIKLCMDIKFNFEEIKTYQTYQIQSLEQILTLQKCRNGE